MTDPMAMGGGDPMGGMPPPEEDAGGDMTSPAIQAAMDALPGIMEGLINRGLEEGTPEYNKALVQELQQMGFAVKDPNFIAQVMKLVGSGQALPDAGGGEMGEDPMSMPPGPPPPPPPDPMMGGGMGGGLPPGM